MTIRRPTSYDRDQHRMVCDHLDVSDSPLEPGDTAIEAVIRLELENCRLRERLEVLEKAVTGCAVICEEGTGMYLCSLDSEYAR